MNKKPTFAENLRQFIEGKGFYVIVLICVAAIGVSGFYLMRAGVEEPVVPVGGNAQVTLTPSPSPSPSAPGGVPSPSPAVPSPSPRQTTAPRVSAAPAPSPSPSASAAEETVEQRPASLVYTWPVKGQLLADFSLETLAYDETMGDWRTHSGLDIAASLGADVLAAADGTVSRVYADDLMGTTVVIDHGSGMVSTYANLQTVPTVAEGDLVHTGTVIGAVGTTAIAESGRASHLHFELFQDGQAVDPALFLPAQR